MNKKKKFDWRQASDRCRQVDARKWLLLFVCLCASVVALGQLLVIGQPADTLDRLSAVEAPDSSRWQLFGTNNDNKSTKTSQIENSNNSSQPLRSSEELADYDELLLLADGNNKWSEATSVFARERELSFRESPQRVEQPIGRNPLEQIQIESQSHRKERSALQADLSRFKRRTDSKYLAIDE